MAGGGGWGGGGGGAFCPENLHMLCVVLLRSVHFVSDLKQKDSSICLFSAAQRDITTYLTYVALHEVTWCMVVWCTQNAPRWQQFHVVPAMPAL